MAACSGGLERSSSGPAKNKKRCCSCNGVNARCKSCVCVKSKRACSCCLPMKHNRCANRSLTLAESPLEHSHAALGIDDNATLHDVPTSEVSSHELSAEDPREFEFAAAVINECNNAAVSACSSVLLATDSTSHQRSLVSQSEGLQVNNACCSVGSMGSRKQCAVHGCPELIAPTMWRHHMSLHAKGLLPGSVPVNWLNEHGLFQCLDCNNLVAESHRSSHQVKCTHIVHVDSESPSSMPCNADSESSFPLESLPTFEDICKLPCPTIHHVPSKARPALARALSTCLRSILHENTEDSWKKLFMLPKCLVSAPKRRGRHHKPCSIERLCDQWLKGEYHLLWQRAASQTNGKFRQRQQENNERKVKNSVALAREGLLGKACQALTSAGIAPNNNETWELIQSKHPKGPPPIPPAPSTPPIPILSKDFNTAMVLRSFPKSTACGPSGLRIQHLLDTAEVPLQFPISSSLRDIVNLLASGKVPVSVSRHLAGGSLTALVKGKPGLPPDIRPIAVGEALRRLTGKCLCAVLKSKASEFFAPFQFGVACPAGAEKVIHGLRHCIEEHWEEEDFVVLKIDMCNAFNLVSRQALLDECAFHFPDLLPWASWCYGQQPLLQHPLGTVTSEVGVQQGDPLGPMLFSLVLHKLVSAIATDEDTAKLLFHAWYLDDGVVAGPKQSVLHALTIIQELGPPLGLVINPSKCELYSQNDMSVFSSQMKQSNMPHLEILGSPIGDTIFCANVVSQKCAQASQLLSQIEEVGSVDPQVALLLLRMCGAFSKMVHLARSTPPSLVAEGFRYFDNDVRHCFASCTGVDTSDDAWEQAQLSLSRGGLGFRRLSKHSPACYIASVCMSGLFSAPQQHLLQSIDDFNHCIPPSKAISFESLTNTPSSQKALSGELEDELFRQLLSKSSVPDRARLLSVSSPHASAWLSVVPSPGLNLHLEPAEFQAAIQWWLGIGVAHGSLCPHCPHSLDPLGHHALTCKHGGDVVNRHNRLRDVFAESCRRACIGVQVEAGSGLGRDEHHTRPADVLATNWMLGKPAAFDFAVTSPLNSSTLHEASVTAGSAAHATEARKHQANDMKCAELGWVSIPVVVETYGCWGTEAKWALSQLASRLAMRLNSPKSTTTASLYGRLSITLVRANVRALLSRAISLDGF